MADSLSPAFAINRASLRMSRAVWQLQLPSGAKLVLLSVLSHYNDARGIAYPSIARLADVCGLHRRTVQAHLALLARLGVLWITRVPGLRTSGYKVDEVAMAALQGGDFSANGAEIATQNGKNGFELQRESTPPALAPAPSAPPPSPTPSPSLWAKLLHSPADQAALRAWQAVRRAKGRRALPNAAQCQQLLQHAAHLGQTLGWVVQTMALNRWASFDPAWLNNQRPPPRLPTVAAPAPAPVAVPVSAPALSPLSPLSPLSSPAPKGLDGLARARALLARWRTEGCQK